MIRVAAIGECMLELTHRDEQTLALGYGGDTLNTALYLARTAAGGEIAVDYLTAVGDDPLSETMVRAWQAGGIGIGRVARPAGPPPRPYPFLPRPRRARPGFLLRHP